MLIRWFPNSWVQIKTKDKVIYFDPSFVRNFYPTNWDFGKYSNNDDDVLPANLEKADLILISHLHFDHFKEMTANRISDGNTIILSPQIYNNQDQRVKIVNADNKYEYKGVVIEVVKAYNTLEGKSTMKFHKVGECVGYIINVENRRLYFSGDTDFIPEMKNLGNIDIAFLPIGGTYTMDVEEAAQAAMAINPKVLIPIHFLKANPEDIRNILLEKGIDVKILNIGQEIEF